MARYNLYKIDYTKLAELKSKLLSSGLSLTKSEVIDGYEYEFYLSNEPEPTPIWWVEVYRRFIPPDQTPHNLSHFSALLITKVASGLAYVVSLGKTHFYLKDYVDIDFGINLAERIADEEDVKLKATKQFGGKKNKTITSYQRDTRFDIEAGESVQYLKARTSDSEKWGTTVSFGQSTQFNLDIEPGDLHHLIEKVETALHQAPVLTIPRTVRVENTALSRSLDQKLVAAINDNTGSDVSEVEFTVSGVEFIFPDKYEYYFKYQSHKSERRRELSIENLRGFLEMYGITLNADTINEIKIVARNETERGWRQPLKYFLEFQDDARHFLLGGDWHQFNQAYLDFLSEEVDKIPLRQLRDKDHSLSALSAWQRTRPPGSVKYGEAYFNHLRQSEGLLNLDRKAVVLSGRFSLEQCDLYDLRESSLNFVKIGEPNDFIYAVDQSTASLKSFQHKALKFTFEGRELAPRQACLWLVLKRATAISKLSDFKSLILLMKLNDWARLCRNLYLDPVVKISYVIE